jgi:hypothetical protein
MFLSNFTFGHTSLDSLLPARIRETLHEQNWSEYQNDIENRLKMFNDDWSDLLIAFIKSQLSVESCNQFFPPNTIPKWPIPVHVNLFKRVVNEISLVYMNEPIRKMRKEIQQDGEEGVSQEDIEGIEDTGEVLDLLFEESERYAEIVDDDYNIMMQKVNQLTNAVNMCLVLVTPDETKDAGIRFDVLTPDMFVPIQNPDDPSELLGVIYVISSTDTAVDLVSKRKEVIVYMGKEDEEGFIAEIDNDTNKEAEKQPYPFIYKGEKYLPFAIFRSDYPETGQFVNRTLGDDLYTGTIYTAWLISCWMRNFFDSTGKQLMITGAMSGESPPMMIRDSLAVLRFPYPKENTEVTQVDFSMDVESRWRALLQFIESVIANWGLNIDRFKSTPASGISLKIQNQPLINQISKQWAYYRWGESELASIIRKINNSMVTGVEGIPDDYEFSIDFGRLPFEDNPIELWDTYVAMAQKGIKSFADIYMIFDQDISDVDDAQLAIKRNLKMNRELGASGENLPDQLPIPIEAEDEVLEEPNPLLEQREEEGEINA